MADMSNRGGSTKDKAQDTAHGNRDKGQDLGGTARQTTADNRTGAQGATATATQKAQDVASNLGQKAQDIASDVAQRAREAASNLQEKASGAVSSVGDSMSSLAGTLRQQAPNEGMMGTAASTVADTLESGGRYLSQHDFGAMVDDLGGIIRSRPVASICVAFGLGWLAGMAARR